MHIKTKPKSNYKSKFEAFYVQSMESECDSGCLILPEDQYVNSLVFNEILEANNPFPCHTTGKMEVWTTNPDFQPKSKWESVNFVSEAELKEMECNTLFDSLIESDYAVIGDSWNPYFLSVTWSDGGQEDVESAIAKYLDAAPTQADIDEYKRLKSKLGL